MRKLFVMLLLSVLLGGLYGRSDNVGANSDYNLTVGLHSFENFEESRVVEGDVVGIEVEGSKIFDTTSIIAVFFKKSEHGTHVVAEFDHTIDPEWDWFYSYYSGLEKGEYTFKFYTGEAELLVEGMFEVE